MSIGRRLDLYSFGPALAVALTVNPLAAADTDTDTGADTVTGAAADSNSPERDPNSPELLDIESLPMIDVLPDVAYGKAPNVLPEAERAAAKVIDFSRSPVALWSPSYARPASMSVVISVHLGHPDRHSAQGFTRFLQLNPEVPAITANCAGGADLERPVDAFTLARRPDGTFHYIHMHAWFNYAACKGLLLRSTDAPVVPIAGGVAYAYRTQCDRCKAGENETLHVLTPMIEKGSVTADRGQFRYWTRLINHIQMPLDPGTGSTMAAELSSESMARWRPVASRPLPLRATSIRMEVTRATLDKVATALVWVR